MTKKILLSLPFVVVLAVTAMPLLASASALVDLPNADIYKDEGGFFALISRIVKLLFTLLIILAVVFILWAAFKYLTAGGNAEKVQEAGKMVLYAVVAIAIAVLARVVPTLVCNVIGVSGCPTVGAGGTLN